MKDLDFDELDRAVNTLMGNVTATAEPAKLDDMKTLTITSTLTDDRPPVLPVGEVKASAEPSTDTRATPVSVTRPPLTSSRPASLAARRGGRFMDVVPSSAAKKNATSYGVSRQGLSVTPTTGVDESKSAPAPILSDDAIDTLPNEPDASTWPDPLDFNQSAPAGNDESTVDEPVSIESNDTAEPLNSPFLTDAKVEKRPLGTPAPELYATPQSEAEVADLPVETEEVTEETDNQARNVILPEELQGDLMAIESGVSEAPSVTTTPQDVPAPIDTLKEEQKVEAPKATVATQAAVVPMGTGSIPQQYREEPSTSDQTTGSIYDTDSYHQPLDHPAKKKTGWLWVLWVIILLILGAGGGALAYLYLLQ